MSDVVRQRFFVVLDVDHDDDGYLLEDVACYVDSMYRHVNGDSTVYASLEDIVADRDERQGPFEGEP